MTDTLSGVGSTPLVGVGTARWYRPTRPELPERPDPETVDTTAQRERFDRARATAREAIQRARDRTADSVGADEAAVFEAHEQFLDDPQLADEIETAIADGTPAEHAVADAFGGHIEQFEAMDGRMAERADDLREVRDRLLRALLGVESADLTALPDGTVLLADRLTPGDTVQLDPESVAGIVTVTGGRTAHAAIIARSLSIPAVVGVGEALGVVTDGTELLVDGERGEVVVDPGPNHRKADSTVDTDPVPERVTTADGRAVEVAANVGSPTELAPAGDRGADGVGLFRTEFLFLDREEPPDEDEQYEAITAALRAFPDDRVVVRTPDIGGDKQVPYLDLPTESNPFLGQRGIRLSLGPHSALFETHLRALLRAGATDEGGRLAVMLPMVARVEEVVAARERIETVAEMLDDEGVDYARPELGAMVETPAATYVADALADRLDFLSLGTNDLTQYVMAADRENDAVAELQDPLHPAVLRAIDRTTTAAHEGDAWVGMCGEMAGDPGLTELLVGLGLDELSMSAVTVPAVKRAVREIDGDAAATLARDAVACETREAVAALLE
ncbi:phosphoenolpyruvate--protein phosphotransferase [Halomicroarcula sp. GCM10025709]|uniref:phosphoenolpyruvate--protein phosphotransferase n=1 Tax=Haloarcula TaxID=2237 RepID=UPI0024C366D6|nr:phosphoenolpyruvate--protein phosphotransferase [Halomicroarcula sp. YJ-61-S]